jgi:hypothetical protein
MYVFFHQVHWLQVILLISVIIVRVCAARKRHFLQHLHTHIHIRCAKVHICVHFDWSSCQHVSLTGSRCGCDSQCRLFQGIHARSRISWHPDPCHHYWQTQSCECHVLFMHALCWALKVTYSWYAQWFQEHMFGAHVHPCWYSISSTATRCKYQRIHVA